MLQTIKFYVDNPTILYSDFESLAILTSVFQSSKFNNYQLTKTLDQVEDHTILKALQLVYRH